MKVSWQNDRTQWGIFPCQPVDYQNLPEGFTMIQAWMGSWGKKKTVEFRHKSWGLNSQSTDLTQQTGGIHLRRSSPTDIRTSTKRNRAGTPKIHLPEVDLQDLCCAMRNFEGSLPQIHRMPTSGRSHPWWTPAPKVFNLPTAFFLDSSRPNHPTLTPILFL